MDNPPATPKQKKILFFAENTTSLQHLTRSRLLGLLRNEGGLACTVVVPPSLQPSEEELRLLEGVKFLTLDIHGLRPKGWLARLLNKPFHVMSRDLVTARSPHSILAQDRAHVFQRKKKNFSRRLQYARLLTKMGLRYSHLTQMAEGFGHYPEVDEVLDAEQPDYVVYFNILIGQMDFLKEVRRRNIPLILDVPNWDQASSKGPMTVLPDHVFVWSDFIREDFCSIHDYPREKVTPIGAMQFDCYFQGEPPLSREEFCRHLNIDPVAKIILYAYGVIPGIDTCAAAIIEILDIAGENKHGFPCHLVFRASPRHPFPEVLKGRQDVSVQHPLGKDSEAGLGWISAPNEEQMRMSTLLHCDIVINVFSTMCLDGLCLDKPVINIGYACGTDENLPNPMERIFKYSHLIPVMESDGTWIPRNKKQFKQAVAEALSNPGARRTEGAALLKHICGPADGRTYRRWFEAFRKVQTLEEDRCSQTAYDQTSKS